MYLQIPQNTRRFCKKVSSKGACMICSFLGAFASRSPKKEAFFSLISIEIPRKITKIKIYGDQTLILFFIFRKCEDERMQKWRGMVFGGRDDAVITR